MLFPGILSFIDAPMQTKLRNVTHRWIFICFRFDEER